MKIAIIGAGNLGLAIAKGIINNKSAQALYITKRNINTLKELEGAKDVFLTSDNKEAIKNSDSIIFAVQPRHLEEVLNQCKEVITEGHTLISTVTGFSTGKIEKIVGEDRSIIRAMPNTAISINQSMTCICANQKGKERINLAFDIFNQLGHSIEIPEEQMQAATVICASGIAFWMRLIRATTQGAIELGFESKEALEMSVHTCLGAARLLISSHSHPEQEIDKVTTPGGCTIAGLNEMEHQGLSSSIIKGLITSYNKISQIAKN
ncbi:MAG: pyrroline-5-carboxylate reductase [Flavobacteriaceae bacterium]|jgi:pyrroline-5-carboxylate reductase|nr:pyrroline-5-carboxylate reductase [Flavobacteriaceae bacterium]